MSFVVFQLVVYRRNYRRVDLFILCHASLNLRACLVEACPRSLVCDQSNLRLLSSACVAGRDLGSCRLIASLCSVSHVSIFLNVSPMYCLSQLRQGNI